jgi:hypothetical protein
MLVLVYLTLYEGVVVVVVVVLVVVVDVDVVVIQAKLFIII